MAAAGAAEAGAAVSATAAAGAAIAAAAMVTTSPAVTGRVSHRRRDEGVVPGVVSIPSTLGIPGRGKNPADHRIGPGGTLPGWVDLTAKPGGRQFGFSRRTVR